VIGADRVAAGDLRAQFYSRRTIDGEYAIYGCAKVRDGWSKKKWQAVTYASLEDGEWYFSDLLFVFSEMHSRDPDR
jgi:hypothetical protein